MASEDNYKREDAAYWREVHESAAKRLAELRAERDTLEANSEALSREIVRFESLLSSLNPLTSDGAKVLMIVPIVEGIVGLTLADACREILKHSANYRTARSIRDSLANSGYDLSQHTNPLASIHGVLKRLGESSDVEVLESEGKTRYRWKGQPGIAAASGQFGISAPDTLLALRQTGSKKKGGYKRRSAKPWPTLAQLAREEQEKKKD